MSRDGSTAESWYLGLDLGGNHIKIGISRGGPDLVWRGDRPSGVTEGRDGILAALRAAAREGAAQVARRGGTLGSVGLGTPGVVDPSTGRILHEVANLPDWRGVDLRGLLEQEVGVPAHIENDGNAAVYGEWLWGAGTGESEVVMVTVGTGIGGGAIVNGELVRGNRGAGMELGHIPQIPDGRRCGCGKIGCLEAHAGGRSLLEIWRSRAGVPAAATLRDLLEAANGGEPEARGVLEEGADVLGVGLVAALHMLNPAVLILGGGIVEACPWYGKRVEERLRERALEKALLDLRIQFAHFGNGAGVIGALELARELGPGPD